jgi:hypothetical protein
MPHVTVSWRAALKHIGVRPVPYLALEIEYKSHRKLPDTADYAGVGPDTLAQKANEHRRLRADIMSFVDRLKKVADIKSVDFPWNE